MPHQAILVNSSLWRHKYAMQGAADVPFLVPLRCFFPSLTRHIRAYELPGPCLTVNLLLPLERMSFLPGEVHVAEQAR